MNKKILCVGSLVVDIINRAIPRTPDAVNGISTTFTFHLGGNAYNAAVDLQQLGWQADQIICVGSAGTDYFGELFQQGLKQHGIHSGICLVPNLRTSKNLIIQVEGEEPQHNFDGSANSSLSLDYVLNCIQEFQPALFYIGIEDFEMGMPVFEITSMAEAGMTPMQIIVASTRNAAEACNKLSEIGTLEPGKAADLLIVRGDPLSDIHALTDVLMVIHSGVVIVEND